MSCLKKGHAVRLIFGVLAIIGLVALVTGEAVHVGGFATVALALLIPLLILKMLFMGVAFGIHGKKFMRQGPPFGRSRRAGYRRDWRDSSPTEDDHADPGADFAEWHRMAHARHEVDSWVEGSDPEDADTPE